MTVTMGDILAAIDVVSELLDQCDEMDVDEALAMREALVQLQSETRRAESMVTTAAKTHLEGSSRQIGDRLYAMKPTGKWRFRHDQVAQMIQDVALAIDPETGEMRSAEEAVGVALGLAQEAWVSPASTIKMGLLERFGLQRQDAARWERTGTEIVVTDLSAPDGAE